MTTTRTVRVSVDMHRLLRMRAVENDCSINDILMSVMDMTPELLANARPTSRPLRSRPIGTRVEAEHEAAALPTCPECLAPTTRDRSRKHRPSCSRYA